MTQHFFIPHKRRPPLLPDVSFGDDEVVREVQERHMTLDAFEEHAHARGQPDNAGQFASSPGSTHPKATPPPKTAAAAAALTPHVAPITKKPPKKAPGTAQAHLVPAHGEGKARTTHTGEPLPEHIQKLAIPPAWTNVKYSPDPNAALLVTGRDAAGRGQYRYSAKHSESNAMNKFARIKNLDSIFDRVVDRNEQDRQTNNPALKDSAEAAHLIMRTGIRPGGEASAVTKKKAYGATTLLGKHIRGNENGMHMSFVGKDGVSINLPVHDPDVRQMLARRRQQAGPQGQLFPNTNDTRLAKYVKDIAQPEGGGGDYTTKDFRTLMGTKTAMREIENIPVPKDPKEYKQAVAEVAKRVSKVLGNTPAIALQSYISPVVFAEWQHHANPNIGHAADVAHGTGDAEWDPDKHPRGQEAHPGQFAPIGEAVGPRGYTEPPGARRARMAHQTAVSLAGLEPPSGCSTTHFNSLPAQQSWEAAPGMTTGHMPEYHVAEYPARAAYQTAMTRALTDPTGHDIISKRLGLNTSATFMAPGVFEGRANPGAQSPSRVRTDATGTVHPDTRARMNIAEAVRGTLLRQDAAAWHVPTHIEGATPDKMNMVDFGMGRRIRNDESVKIAEALKTHLGHDFFSPVSTKSGFRLLNVPEFSGHTNEDFQDQVHQALAKTDLPDMTSRPVHFDGNYLPNDWSEHKGGQGYQSIIQDQQRPDLHNVAHDLLRELTPKVRNVEDTFADKYGWTPNRNEQFWEQDHSDVPLEQQISHRVRTDNVSGFAA